MARWSPGLSWAPFSWGPGPGAGGLGGVMRAWHAIGALGRHAAPNVGPARCCPGRAGRGGGVCGWVGCELHSGREHQMRLCALACPGCGVVCVISFVSLLSLRASLWCSLGFCLLCLFVFMGVRWMPWHQGPMKDVVACDKPRGAG